MEPDSIDKLFAKLKIKYKDKELINQAFIHRSYLNESKIKLKSNERLEFLGDSILSFIVSRFLYLEYPKLPEGELTNLRSSVVKTTALSDIAKTLNLGSLLKMSHGEEDGGGRSNPSILADTFEALIGSIFLDSGIKSVEIILNSCLTSMIPKIFKDKTYKDAKSSFQELVQEKNKLSPLYKVVKEFGPDHAKQFTVAVFVNETNWGEGIGKSKQEAEQGAAMAALEKWKKK